MTADRVVTLAILLASLAFLFLILPLGTETIDYGTLSPDSMPRATAWAIVLLAAIQLILPVNSAESMIPAPAEAARAILSFALTAVGVALMPRLGFLPVAIVLALAICLLMSERRPLWLALSGVVLPAAIWIIVTILLDRTLP